MSSIETNPFIVLPRPGTPFPLSSPIRAPPQSLFTKTFGTLLPLVQYNPIQNYTTRILLIHGVQIPALGMLPLVQALQSSFPHAQFVLFDLWGHGLSDTPMLPHEPRLFYDLIDAILDALSWERVHLLGFSFGGAISIGYVISRQTRVKSFALVAPAGVIQSSTFGDVGRMSLGRGGDEQKAAKWVIEVLEGGKLCVPEDWEDRVARWQMREHKGHFASVIGILRDGGIEYDVCNKEQLEKLGFKDVRVVEGAGHGVVRERVLEISTLIEERWGRSWS
ncbi:Alpha/Beta hydrolase protein [Phaeosphaeriaceae sp. PMI808]|nr:Alpha/Beta hydrolase protein [Phaeosphaeriaceae sp. PMI808]